MKLSDPQERSGPQGAKDRYGAMGDSPGGGGGRWADGSLAGRPGTGNGKGPSAGRKREAREETAGHRQRPVQPDKPWGGALPVPRGPGPGGAPAGPVPPGPGAGGLPGHGTGVPGGRGRQVYPYNFQAAAVLQALWTACQEAGVQARWDSPVTGVRREKGGFLLETAGREKLFARQCLLCAGGKASPKHSKGEGYSLAEGLGHQVTALRPSLAPLKSPAKCLRSLKGMRARAKAGLYRRGRLVWEESGEVQFGDGALSGICVFDLSARLEGPGPWEVRLDLAEDWEEAQALGYLKDPAPAAPPPPGRGPAGGVSQSAGGLGAGEALRPRWGPAPGPDRGQAAGGRCQAHQELGLPGDRAGALGERPGHPGRGAPGGGGPGDAGIETLPRAVPDRGTVKRGRGLRWL